MDFKVLPQSVQGQAVSKLRDAIVTGIFRPGDRLVESDLCTRLGISRPSVREALRSLEAERLVVIVPNRGPMIPILTVDMARQIYDVRACSKGKPRRFLQPTHRPRRLPPCVPLWKHSTLPSKAAI